ncbi:MAG: hypothetical protein IMY76_07775 [Chloroflexi bacterium]|nr:hypothetical protein [Chloroflexota bacterium]
MSIEQVNQVLGRVLLDETFREQLLNNADRALQGFDLTNQEIESLKSINAEQINTLSETFQAQLGGAEPSAIQEANFIKIDGIDGESIKIDDANFMKIDDVPVKTTGFATSQILAIGAGTVMVLGALVAGYFFLRGANNPEQIGVLPAPASTTPAESSEIDETIPQSAVIERSVDLICLTEGETHLCAAPAGQIIEQLGDKADDPIMLPLTPEQAVIMVSASGGSPTGVQGFSVMMLSGPETYSIHLPGSPESEHAIFLADAQGSPYFGVGAYFPDGIFTSGLEFDDKAAVETGSSIAGTWQDLPGSGTMTCNGASMDIPSESADEIVISKNGQDWILEGVGDFPTLELILLSDGTYQADIDTLPDDTPGTGQIQLTLISPDTIEGLYTGTFESCTYTKPITMTRISSAETKAEDSLAPLKPAEFSVEELFNPGDTFIPQIEVCISFPDVCKDERTFLESINALMSGQGWGTGKGITNGGDIFLISGGGGAGKAIPISNNCDTSDSSQTGTACVPAPEQGDAYIPPYPADAGWGSKGVGYPTLVSVLDVNAISVINGIFDLWMVMGIPQADDWDGFVDINTNLIQVYELDSVTGQQTQWNEIEVTYDTLDISTDQNRLFIIYLFLTEEDALNAPETLYPPQQ